LRTKQENKKIPKIRLIKRQEIWMLTIQGWVILFALLAYLLTFLFSNLYPFLAVTSPIKSDVLVIEGWIKDDELKQAAVQIEKNPYYQVFTTGIPVPTGFYLAEYNNFAKIAAVSLEKMGVPKEKIIVVPTPGVIKDRTQAAAVALSQYLSQNNFQIKTVNLFTADAHARRSWFLFKKILTPQIKVGVIASQPGNYNPQKWWSSSEGVRTVISELIAYIYALFVSTL
jgi:hypothetical protein